MPGSQRVTPPGHGFRPFSTNPDLARGLLYRCASAGTHRPGLGKEDETNESFDPQPTQGHGGRGGAAADLGGTPTRRRPGQTTKTLQPGGRPRTTPRAPPGGEGARDVGGTAGRWAPPRAGGADGGALAPAGPVWGDLGPERRRRAGAGVREDPRPPRRGGTLSPASAGHAADPPAGPALRSAHHEATHR
jgi:hypothetical protein